MVRSARVFPVPKSPRNLTYGKSLKASYTQVSSTILGAIQAKAAAGGTLSPQEQSILNSYNNNATNTTAAVAGGKTLTPASDVYSIAVILYEVLTGKLPFDAKSAMDYISLHVTGKPIPISQRVPGKTFPPLLDEIMERALAKRSEDRYASAADFGAALQLVMQGATKLPAHLSPSPQMDAPTAPIAFTPSPPSAQAMPAPTPQPPTPQPPHVAMSPAVQAGPVAIPPAPPAAARSSKTNVGLLVGVAVGFLLLGVGLALALSKLMAH